MKINNLTKLLIIAGAAVMFAVIPVIPLMAEAVFLKDGSIIEGTIVADGAGSVTVRMNDRKRRKILRGDIMRILYTELKLGKIYVQKRDGKGIVAHIVDEDRESYTFRKELYSPAEFKLKRSEVLFMAEKNPSGLQVEGDVETDRVSLKWLPPYDEVKKYNLYIKKNDKDKYELIDSTGSRDITLKNLSSNTVYYMIVTAVDTGGYESSPGNELKITTKNVPPRKPEGITRHIKKKKLTIKWRESSDPDGEVRGYNIYHRDDKEKKKIAEIKKPEYNVPGNVSVYKLEITAVDNLGSESSEVRVLMPMQLVFSAAPAIFTFTGDLGEMFDPGYGGTFTLGLRNLMFQNFEAGINAGCLTFKGIDEMNTHSMTLIPATVYGGYHFRTGDWFSVFPFARIGGSYSKVKYTNVSIDKEKTIIDPVVYAGVSFTAGGDHFTFSAGADYGFLYESAGVRPFYEGFISFGTLFEMREF